MRLHRECYETVRRGSLFDRILENLDGFNRARGRAGGDVEEYVCPFISRNAVFVRWDGNVAPCMQLLHSCYTYLYEEQRRITAFFYGNIRDRTLMDCWQDPSYAEFRQRVPLSHCSFFFGNV